MGSTDTMRNLYLEQVVQETEQVAEDLAVRKSKVAFSRRGAEAEFASAGAVGVRVTGFWRWRNVIVPPNAYVVHTRRGRDTPVNLGLGISFRFNPVTDTFLVVPATMQTIMIRANCICAERQGLVVQGYVQWIIDDFATAYQKLDFSDEDDPMRIVNITLKEQAEAAIKDKVATMSIDDVLADKRPIIEELTSRLRHTAEGQGDDGLGLRITTVQIKEAIVSSPRLWETLQRPFRAERNRHARLAELASEAEIAEREAREKDKRTRLMIESEQETARLRADAQAAKAEAEARAAEESAAHRQRLIEIQRDIAKAELEQKLELAKMEAIAQREIDAYAIATLAERRKIENDRSAEAVRMALIEQLPEVAGALPRVDALTSLTLGNDTVGAVKELLSGPSRS